jgi:hypothetical protein
MMIMDTIYPSMTHVEQIDTRESLSSQVQELPNTMIRRNETFKSSMRIRETLNNGGHPDSVSTGEWAECV